MRFTTRRYGAATAGLTALVALAACSGPTADDTVCRCTPANTARGKLADGTAMDSAGLLNQLHRHRQDVAQHKNPRDIKMFDDQLRFAILDYCQPCGDWVHDRMTMEELFPLDRLDDAASAVCMGLVLRDGTTAWGSARPLACRK